MLYALPSCVEKGENKGPLELFGKTKILRYCRPQRGKFREFAKNENDLLKFFSLL